VTTGRTADRFTVDVYARPDDNGGTGIRSANLGSRLPDLVPDSDDNIDLYVGVKAPGGFEKTS